MGCDTVQRQPSGSPSATEYRGILLGTDGIPEGRKCDTLAVCVKRFFSPIIFKGDKRKKNVFTETLCCGGKKTCYESG